MSNYPTSDERYADAAFSARRGRGLRQVATKLLRRLKDVR